MYTLNSIKTLRVYNEQAKKILHDHSNIISVKTSLLFYIKNFFSFLLSLPNVIRFSYKNPSILFLFFLQGIVILLSLLAFGLIYLAIVPALNNTQTSIHHLPTIFKVIIFIANCLVMLLMSYPLALLAGAIAGFYLLSFNKKQPTIMLCLTMSAHHVGKIWIFSFINQMIKFGKKKDGEGVIIAQSWNLLTMGMIPGLFVGKSFVEAGKDSLEMLKQKILEMIGVSIGYTMMSTLVACIMFALPFSILLSNTNQNSIFYFIISTIISLSISIIFVFLLVKPIYYFNVCKLYFETINITQYLENELNNKISITYALLNRKLILFCSILAAFILLLVALHTSFIQTWLKSLPPA